MIVACLVMANTVLGVILDFQRVGAILVRSGGKNITWLTNLKHPWALGIAALGLLVLTAFLIPPALILLDLKTALPYSFYKTYFIQLAPLRWTPFITTGAALTYCLYYHPDSRQERYLLYGMTIAYLVIGLTALVVGYQLVKFFLKYAAGFDREFLMR